MASPFCPQARQNTMGSLVLLTLLAEDGGAGFVFCVVFPPFSFTHSIHPSIRLKIIISICWSPNWNEPQAEMGIPDLE